VKEVLKENKREEFRVSLDLIDWSWIINFPCENENVTHGFIKIVSLPGQIAQHCPLIELSFAYSLASIGVVAIGVCTRIGTYDVLES
jgi:hypothetical protein